jgi:hypothetical protein
MSATRISSLLLTVWILHTPAMAQTPAAVTYDDTRALAEVVTSFTFQAPEDVNQRPDCQHLSIPCTTPRTVPDGGVALTVSIFPHDRIGLVAEGSVYGNEWSAYGTTCASCSIAQTNKVFAMLGGLRLRTANLHIHRNGNSVRLFTQVLAGPQWSDETRKHYALQPGLGLEHYVWNRTAVIHIEYDYRFTPRDPIRNLTTGRFVIGIGTLTGWI